MAFDGPTPFDGDPVYNYIDEIKGQPPSPFGSAWSIPNPSILVPAALEALRVVADPKRSEIAGLWNEQGGPTLELHLESLLTRLSP